MSRRDLGLRRALLTHTGGAWRYVQRDGAAWREVRAPKFTMDCPDVRLRCADEGARATKLWSPGPDGWAKASEGSGFRFAAEVVWVEDSAPAWADLFRLREDDGGAFLLGGVPGREPEGGLVRRAKVADKGAWPHPVGRRGRWWHTLAEYMLETLAEQAASLTSRERDSAVARRTDVELGLENVRLTLEEISPAAREAFAAQGMVRAAVVPHVGGELPHNACKRRDRWTRTRTMARPAPKLSWRLSRAASLP